MGPQTDSRLDRLEDRLQEFFATGQDKQARKIVSAIFLKPDNSPRTGAERVVVMKSVHSWIRQNCKKISRSTPVKSGGFSLKAGSQSAVAHRALPSPSNVVQKAQLTHLSKIKALCDYIADRIIDVGGINILFYGWSLHAEGNQVGMQLVASIMQRSAASLERTLKFWSVLQRDFEAFIQQHEPLAAEDAAAMVATPHPLIFDILYDIASKPVGTRWPEKGLLTNLIDNSLNGRSDVDAMLTGLLELLFYHQEGEQMSFYWQDAIEKDLTEQGKTINDITIKPFDPADPVVTLYGKQAEQIERLVQENQSRLKALLLQVQDFNDWLKHSRKQVERCCREKRQQIRERYSVPVLPNGQDFIEITLSVLQVCGVRNVAFHPEGMTWPDVGLKITCEKEAGAVCVFDAKLIDFDLEAGGHIFNNHFNIPDSFLRTILTYIVIDAYYVIAVLDEDQSQDRICAGRCFTVSHDGPKRIKSIRGRFVSLPDGYKHSEEAITTAMFGMNLSRNEVLQMWPPGKTYRRTYDMSIYTNRRLVNEPQPVMRVTDSSFREAFTVEK